MTEDKGSCIRIIDDICEGIGEGTVGEYSKLKNHLGNLFICTLQAFGNNRKRLEEDAAREVDFVNKAIQINDYWQKLYKGADSPVSCGRTLISSCYFQMPEGYR